MKTSNVSLFIALISISLAIMSFFGRRYTLSPDTALAIVGVCTTMIVGVSVVDRMAIHDIEKRMEKLEDLEKKTDTMKTNANIANHVAFGLAYFNWQPEATIKEIYKAIEIAMRVGDAKRTNTCVDNLQKLVDLLGKRSEGFSSTQKKKMINSIPKSLENTELYIIFKDKLAKLEKSIDDLHESEPK